MNTPCTLRPTASPCTARDVTERRLAEEAGRRSHEELRQRVAERTRHLAAINEDLIRQISERERVEEELRRANETVTEILESITDAFCAFDQDWHYTYVNERATQMLGKSRDQLIGRSALELFPEFEGREDYHKCQQAMQEHAPVYFESFSPVFDRRDQNQVYPTKEGVSIYWRDITERKRAEEKLAYHGHLLENIHDAVIATDEQLLITAWNKGAQQCTVGEPKKCWGDTFGKLSLSG